MTKLQSLQRLARMLGEAPDPARLEGYLERIGVYDEQTVTQACRNLESTLLWFPKLPELLEQCRLEDAKRPKPTLVRDDDDPRGHYRCFICRDTGWEELHCQGGDTRSCGGTDNLTWQDGAAIGSCKGPHPYVRRCYHHSKSQEPRHADALQRDLRV